MLILSTKFDVLSHVSWFKSRRDVSLKMAGRGEGLVTLGAVSRNINLGRDLQFAVISFWPTLYFSIRAKTSFTNRILDQMRDQREGGTLDQLLPNEQEREVQ